MYSPSALLPERAEDKDAGGCAADDPAPERKGEIAARESLEPEGARNGLAAGRDPQLEGTWTR